MKSIKEMTDDVIDIVHENSYKEIEEDHDEDGHYLDINLSPTPACYDRLNQYFAEMYAGILLDVLKNHYGKKVGE